MPDAIHHVNHGGHLVDGAIVEVFSHRLRERRLWRLGSLFMHFSMNRSW